MYLKAKGKSHQEIAEFTGLSLNGLTHIFKLYAQEGLSAVRILNYSLPKSALDPYRELLKKHFEQHPPASVNQACDDIGRLTGITRSPSRIHTFLHQLGMQPRKVGGIPSKADPERQEEFKKKVWSQC
jgi:transposase